MTKKCLICKIEASPISNRSFHMFPKNELVRKKWMDALNLSTPPNFKTTYICSNHFDDKFFNYSDEFRRRKRLRLEAVPENINLNQFYLSIENIKKEPVTERVLVSSVNGFENNILKEENLETNKDCDKIKICREKMPVNSLDESYLNEQDCSYERLEAVPENINLNQFYLSIENIKKEPVTERVLVSSVNGFENNILKEENLEINKDCDKEIKIYREKMPVNSLDESFLNEQDCSYELNNSVSNDANSKKREDSLMNDKAIKRIRFMNCLKTEYISRKDFVSDEAWNRFLRFTTYERSKIAAAHNKNSRKEKQIKSLEVLIKDLEKKR